MKPALSKAVMAEESTGHEGDTYSPAYGYPPPGGAPPAVLFPGAIPGGAGALPASLTATAATLPPGAPGALPAVLPTTGGLPVFLSPPQTKLAQLGSDPHRSVAERRHA